MHLASNFFPKALLNSAVDVAFHAQHHSSLV